MVCSIPSAILCPAGPQALKWEQCSRGQSGGGDGNGESSPRQRGSSETKVTARRTRHPAHWWPSPLPTPKIWVPLYGRLLGFLTDDSAYTHVQQGNIRWQHDGMNGEFRTALHRQRTDRHLRQQCDLGHIAWLPWASVSSSTKWGVWTEYYQRASPTLI